MRPMLIFTTVITLFLAFAGLLFWDRMVCWTATAQADRAAVWVYNPYLAPGDEVVLNAAVYGGKKAGIEFATVQLGQETQQVKGRGKHWGYQIYTKSSDRGNDDVDLVVALPENASAGDKIEGRVVIEWVRAGHGGVGRFNNDHERTEIPLTLQIYTPTEATFYRLLSGMKALLALVIACGGGVLFWHQAKRLESRYQNDKNATEMFSCVLLLWAFPYALAGWLFFAWPIMITTGLETTFVSAACQLLWFILPMVFVWWLTQRALQKPRYTIGSAQTPLTVTPRWIKRLEREERLKLTVWGPAWRISDGEDTLWGWARRGQLLLWRGNDGFAISFGLALSKLAGPLPMTIHSFHIHLSPARTLEEVQKELDEVCQKAMELAMAALRRTQVLMDQLGHRIKARNNARY